MIKKENFEKTSAWPFVEAKKMLRERKSFIEKKGKIILQTGYGPSGLPHIGTFGEVARTSMIVNALKHLTDLPTEIITFSDDMDGLRKVPDNVPQKDLLEKNLHKPLTEVPDPFKKFNSFGEHNNQMLKNFLDNFNFKYNFKSSTDLYKSGFFNSTLQIILENYDGIMNIILPTLGKERQKTYSPFLPVCPETGQVLEIPVKDIDKKNFKITFNNNGKELEKSILSLDDYPIDDWNPKICEGVEFYIDSNANWFFNGSKIDRPAMVKLFSKLVKYEDGQYFAVTPVEKIPIKVEKEIFSIIDYKQEDNHYFFQTNTEEWVKLSEKNKLTVEMVDNQPYPKIKLKNHIFALLSRNVFYKVIAESKQDGMSMYLESDGKFFYLN